MEVEHIIAIAGILTPVLVTIFAGLFSVIGLLVLRELRRFDSVIKAVPQLQSDVKELREDVRRLKKVTGLQDSGSDAMKLRGGSA